MSPLAQRFFPPAAVVLLLSMTFNLASQSGAAESPSTKNQKGAAETNRLIEQLGSKKFPEREAAAKALEAIGPPAVEALRKTDHSKDPEVRRRVSMLLDAIENSLEQLVIDYQAFGLP